MVKWFELLIEGENLVFGSASLQNKSSVEPLEGKLALTTTGKKDGTKRVPQKKLFLTNSESKRKSAPSSMQPDQLMRYFDLH